MIVRVGSYENVVQRGQVGHRFDLGNVSLEVFKPTVEYRPIITGKSVGLYDATTMDFESRAEQPLNFMQVCAAR